MPLPDQISLELEAIDAALAGDRVDPEFAELAELALLLSDERPAIPADAASRLDVRVSGLASADPTPARRSLLFRPAFGAGLAALVIVAIVVIVLPGGGSSSKNLAISSAGTSTYARVPQPAKQSAKTGRHGPVTGGSSLSSTFGAAGNTGSIGSSSSAANSASGSVTHRYSPPLKQLSPTTQIPTPQANGQKIVQSSQLDLLAPSDRIATVSQELFNVVGAEQGFVKHSSVTSGAGGYASFTLSIPTSNLSATLSRLTSLKYSRVSSSTESTTDVTDTYQDDQRKLADAKALHTSLLKQLAAAYTSEQVASLNAQIKDNEANISADEQALNTLGGKIAYTAVSVQIDAGNVTPATRTQQSSGSGGFTLHKAGHDAVRVLVVAAGVLLIALAVLVPLALILGLAAWMRLNWRRRQRESALDAA